MSVCLKNDMRHFYYIPNESSAPISCNSYDSFTPLVMVQFYSR